MKRFLISISFLFLTGFAIVSCSKNNEEDENNNPGGGNPNPGTCVTANMQFAANIRPILETNCFGCHGNGNQNGGVTLDNYAGVKTVADDGRLVGVISHASGFKPMPQGGAKLSDCNINKIKSWVNAGAPNN